MSEEGKVFAIVVPIMTIFGYAMFAAGQEHQKQNDRTAIVSYQSEGVAHMLENLKGTGFHLCKDGAR